VTAIRPIPVQPDKRALAVRLAACKAGLAEALAALQDNEVELKKFKEMVIGGRETDLSESELAFVLAFNAFRMGEYSRINPRRVFALLEKGFPMP
jgi:hypothetical protein